MAKVRDRHLGSLQGQVGAVVFKMRGNKSFVGVAPAKSRKPKTESGKAVLSSMGVVSKFASAIYKINALKKVWANYISGFSASYRSIESSVFNRIVAVNHRFSSNNYLSSITRLTPEEGNNIFVKKHSINTSELTLEFDIDEALLKELSPKCDFFLMIHLSHPLGKKSDKVKDNHKFIILKKSEKSFTLNDKDNTFSFPFNLEYKKALDDFRKAMVFFSIVSYDENVPLKCANAESFILKGMELHEADVKEHERIKGIKTKKQIKAEKTLENPDFQSAIV